MIAFFDKIKYYLIWWISSLLVITFLFWGVSHAADDLLWKLMAPAKYSENIIDLWENVTTVWNNVFQWSVEVGTDWIGSSASIIVKVTRLLLVLIIALSVTMILYNWMIYIIQTWQWKEWKSLIKNVVLIVVWIFVALFSIVIINLIQSIPTTLDGELTAENNNTSDNKVLDGKGKSWDIGKVAEHIF